MKRFEKFNLHFSISLFVIRVNLLHPCFSLFIIISLVLSIFVKHSFEVSFHFKVILLMAKKKTQNAARKPLYVDQS